MLLKQNSDILCKITLNFINGILWDGVTVCFPAVEYVILFGWFL